MTDNFFSIFWTFTIFSIIFTKIRTFQHRFRHASRLFHKLSWKFISYNSSNINFDFSKIKNDFFVLSFRTKNSQKYATRVFQSFFNFQIQNVTKHTARKHSQITFDPFTNPYLVHLRRIFSAKLAVRFHRLATSTCPKYYNQYQLFSICMYLRFNNETAGKANRIIRYFEEAI